MTATIPDRNIRTAEVNGVTLAYREIGGGYPLVMINGFASTMDTWNPPVLALLARHFRVIIFDNRGTGYSTATGEPFSIPLFASDAAGLMDSCGIDHASILGLSMGASVAQELVLAAPKRVDRLIIVSGTCGDRDCIPIPQDAWARLTDKSGEIADIADRMFTLLFPEAWRRTHDPWQYCPEIHETTSEVNTARQAEAFFGWRGAYDRLPEIRCPALVVTGTGDVIIPPANSDILAARIRGARLVRFPGAGHGLQYQCPEEYVRIIRKFLKEPGHT